MRRASPATRRSRPAVTPLILLAAALLSPVAAHAQTGEAVPTKLERKIRVMEKVINEILRESPNWLVGGGGDYTRSLYLDEFGVIFSFDASLVERFGSEGFSFDGLEWLERLDRIRVETEGDKVIVYEEKDDDADADADKDEEKLTLEQVREKRRSSQERRYEAGKQEVIDALLDYGDTMTDLKDPQNIAVVAYLKNSDLFEREEMSRLIVRAKVGDLRAMADGRLTREEMIKRLRIQEY